MEKNNAISFLLGIILSLTIMFLTIIAYKLEVKPQVIYAENRTPDNAYIDIVSRSEYYSQESGQVIVRTSDGLGNPLNATCNVSIVFPNKTFWVIDSAISSSSIVGNYFKEVTIPNVLGVYEYYFVCNVSFLGKYQIIKKSATFHVSIAYEKFQEILDKLDSLNATINQSIECCKNVSQQIKNLEINMNNNFTYTNDLIRNVSVNINMTNVSINISTDVTENITAQLNDMRSWMDTWFTTIQGNINDLQQRWINFLDTLFTRLLGSSKILQDVVGQTSGVSSGCSLINRILGTCP